MRVYILFHIQHEPEDDGTVQHVDENGVLIWDEQAGDDVKRLGVYSSDERARDRIEHARLVPGFLEEPNCFYISECVVVDDDWTEGFVTDPVDQFGQQPTLVLHGERVRPQNIDQVQLEFDLVADHGDVGWLDRNVRRGCGDHELPKLYQRHTVECKHRRRAVGRG